VPEEKKNMSILNLYLDDSGTRHPSNKQGKKAAHGNDWFAFGGVLVSDNDEVEARRLHSEFMNKWEVTTPLHSSEIRSKNEGFMWLRSKTDEEKAAFYEELYCLMRDAPVIGIGCVIDRPGYNARYAEKYAKNHWLLCKTSFSVLVDRAAKFALSRGQRLRVQPEKCNKKEDRALKAYYAELKADGLPFDATNSGKYAPLTNDQFAATLYDLRFKEKTSPMAQLADLYLWPICIGGYDSKNWPYRRLLNDGKLIECHLNEADHAILGSKYSCFEGVDRK
jgi:hypothetical protein